MNSMERLRERYERRISEIENKERLVTIAKWVGAAVTAAVFIVGVVKAVLLIVERTSTKKQVCCECEDECRCEPQSEGDEKAEAEPAAAEPDDEDEED